MATNNNKPNIITINNLINFLFSKYDNNEKMKLKIKPTNCNKNKILVIVEDNDKSNGLDINVSPVLKLIPKKISLIQ